MYKLLQISLNIPILLCKIMVKKLLKKLKDEFMDFWKYADTEDKKTLKKALGIRSAATATSIGALATYGHDMLYAVPSLSKISYYFLNNPVSYVVTAAMAAGAYSYYLAGKAFKKIYTKKKKMENGYRYDFMKTQKYYQDYY